MSIKVTKLINKTGILAIIELIKLINPKEIIPNIIKTIICLVVNSLQYLYESEKHSLSFYSHSIFSFWTVFSVFRAISTHNRYRFRV